MRVIVTLAVVVLLAIVTALATFKPYQVPPLPTNVPSIVLPEVNEKYRPYICTVHGSSARKAIATFLVSTESEYLESAIVLGRSILKHHHNDATDMILMLLDSSPLSCGAVSGLKGAGWEVCRVPLIQPPNIEPIFPRFRQQFTKLALFTWTQYDNVVYMDADTMAVGPLEGLFHTKYSDLPFAASLDYADGHFREGFNMGVFSMVPDLSMFDYLFHQMMNRTDYRLDMAEQGLMQKLYADRPYYQLPLTMNANLAIFMQDRRLWDQNVPNMSVVHYTMVKPASLRPTDEKASWAPIKLWMESRERAAVLVSPTGTTSNLFLDEQVSTLLDHWHSSPNVDVFVWSEEQVSDNDPLINKDERVTFLQHQHQMWPVSLYERPALFLNESCRFETYDYIFIVDVELMVVSGELGPEINGELVGLEHPGYLHLQGSGRDLPFDRNPQSSAFVDENDAEKKGVYYQGCFYGGRTASVIELWKTLEANIKKDLEQNIMARFHEESHLNRYFRDHPPTKVPITSIVCL